MNKQELRDAFEKGGYIYSISDMNDLKSLAEVRPGVYATIWENWEETQDIVDEFGEEDVAPTYTLDYVFIKDGAAEHGGCGRTFNSIEEAKAQFGS